MPFSVRGSDNYITIFRSHGFFLFFSLFFFFSPLSFSDMEGRSRVILRLRSWLHPPPFIPFSGSYVLYITTGALKNAGAGAKFFWGCKKAYVEAFFFFLSFQESWAWSAVTEPQKKNTCRAGWGGGKGGNILLWVSQDDFGVGKRIGEPKFLNISLGSFRYSTIHRRRSLDGFFFFSTGLLISNQTSCRLSYVLYSIYVHDSLNIQLQIFRRI